MSGLLALQTFDVWHTFAQALVLFGRTKFVDLLRVIDFLPCTYSLILWIQGRAHHVQAGLCLAGQCPYYRSFFYEYTRFNWPVYLTARVSLSAVRYPLIPIYCPAKTGKILSHPSFPTGDGWFTVATCWGIDILRLCAVTRFSVCHFYLRLNIIQAHYGQVIFLLVYV